MGPAYPMFKMTWACGFFLVLLFPQYPSIREIDFSGTIDFDIEKELLPKTSGENCDKENAVNLVNLGFSEIPLHMIKSNQIRYVDLSLNRISRIPNSFFRDAPNIECLNLTRNEISPRMVLDGSYSESLKTLVLDQSGRRYGDGSNYCKMTGHFPNLETLHLSRIDNCYIDISFEDKLPQLATLYLADYDSRTMNYQWQIPSTVRHLHLEGTKFYESIVNTVSNLQSLYLDRYNYNYALNIPSYANLQVVSCRYCSLSSRTIDEFFTIPRNALRLIDFTHNNLSYLPDNMSKQASNLESLLLSNNNFTTTPDMETLTRLRGLVLSHNRIKQVVDMKSDSLKMLSLRGNGISRIYNTTFLGLPALEMLDLSENKLASLPSDWAGSLKNLLTLNLNFNLFARLSDTSLITVSSGLRHLFMKGNLFERFHERELDLPPENCTFYFALQPKTIVRYMP